ncbi:MAG TPA: STM3941 family protein [Gaiellaceae bacterium]|nr:STM3941 family protein [Gaiellaceae bacterium]
MTPWKRRLAALGLLAFFVIGVAGVVLGSSIWERALLGLCAVLFGGVFLIGFPNLLHNRDVPLITVRADGVELKGVGLIQWHEIERVDYTTVGGRTALGIWTTDPLLTARRGSWWSWPFAIFNLLFGYPPLSFTDQAVPIGELHAAIETRRTPTSTQVEPGATGSVSTALEETTYATVTTPEQPKD